MNLIQLRQRTDGEHGTARYLRRIPNRDSNRWEGLELRTAAGDTITLRVERAAPGRITLTLDGPQNLTFEVVDPE